MLLRGTRRLAFAHLHPRGLFDTDRQLQMNKLLYLNSDSEPKPSNALSRLRDNVAAFAGTHNLIPLIAAASSENAAPAYETLTQITTGGQA